MEITFKYQGKIISTPNLEKKLKRMKISIDDIEIIETPKKEEKNPNSGWELEGIKEWRYYKDLKTGCIHCCLIDVGTNPHIYEIFKSHIWNPETKTGVRKITKEYLDTLVMCDYEGTIRNNNQNDKINGESS